MNKKTLFGLLPGLALCGGSSPGIIPEATSEATTPPSPAPLTRDAIAALLRDLPSRPVPEALEPGAMCYKPAMPPQRAEHICPVCGSRTLWGSEGAKDMHPAGFLVMRLLQWELPAMRRQVESLASQVPLTLDERQFCARCSPGVTNPVLVLEVAWPGAAPLRTSDISSSDLQLIAELLSGSAVHKGEQGHETPLTSHKARLQTLLGVAVTP